MFQGAVAVPLKSEQFKALMTLKYLCISISGNVPKLDPKNIIVSNVFNRYSLSTLKLVKPKAAKDAKNDA